METTREIPREDWQAYFERFMKQHLDSGVSQAATVEVLSPALGDQIAAQGTRLQGVSYDPKSRALEVLLEDLDHLSFQPAEVWVIEGADGFISTLEIVQEDGTRELVHIARSGPPAPRLPDPFSPQA